MEKISPLDWQESAQPTETSTANKTEEARMAHLYDKVKYYLEEENIYLNPKLSLANFSLIVGTNTFL